MRVLVTHAQGQRGTELIINHDSLKEKFND